MKFFFDKIIILLIFSLLCSNGIYAAGKLSDFEKSANTPNAKSEKKTHGESYRRYDSEDDDWFSDFCSCLFSVFTSPSKTDKKTADVPYNNRNSEKESAIVKTEKQQKIKSNTSIENKYFENRKKTFTVDAYLNFEKLESDIKALNGGVLFKINGLVFSYNQSYLKEKEPADRLRLNYVNILHNPSLGQKFDIGFGAGLLNLNGDTYTNGISFVLPVVYYANNLIGISFEPRISFIHGNSVKDFDAAVLFTFHKNAALKTGYRSIIVNSSKLNGFYGGLNLRF